MSELLAEDLINVETIEKLSSAWEASKEYMTGQLIHRTNMEKIEHVPNNLKLPYWKSIYQDNNRSLN